MKWSRNYELLGHKYSKHDGGECVNVWCWYMHTLSLETFHVMQHDQFQDVEGWISDVAICYHRFAGLKKQDAWKHFLRILDSKPYGNH